MSSNWITAFGSIAMLIGTGIIIYGVFKTNIDGDAKTSEMVLTS